VKEQALATLGMSAADREAIEKFRRDVVEPSMGSLVISGRNGAAPARR
jgi:putative thioredoxin